MATVGAAAGAVGSAIGTASPYIAAAASLMQFQSTRQAARSEKEQSKTAAKAEELAATQREADRKKRLAIALSSQTAKAGASGILPFEGSPLTILEEDIQSEKVATERDKFNTRLSQMTGLSRGKARSRQLRQKAGFGLMSDVTTIAPTFKPKDQANG